MVPPVQQNRYIKGDFLWLKWANPTEARVKTRTQTNPAVAISGSHPEAAVVFPMKVKISAEITSLTPTGIPGAKEIESAALLKIAVEWAAVKSRMTETLKRIQTLNRPKEETQWIKIFERK
jgi:hypothetical protein